MLSMLKQPIKSGVKAVARTIRRQLDWWDQEEIEQRIRGPHVEREMPVYQWINSLLVKLHREKESLFRPHFAWGMLQSGQLARALGINRISVVEFGVAGGNGLVSMEMMAGEVEALLGIGVDVYGFDTGAGLPKPVDYRDLPQFFQESDYCMDVDKLKKRLNKAQLLLGLVEDTIQQFIDSRPAPVAFISFDFDYYTSTMQAFRLLDADHSLLLPRVHCYFDDIMAYTFSEFNGERLAISDFNHAHPMRKISPIFGLRYYLLPPYANQEWAEKMYLAHLFEHPLYGRDDGLNKRRGDFNLARKDVP
jgi:hypothetical protein